MRRFVVVLVVLAVAAVPAGAVTMPSLGAGVVQRVGPGYVATDNVEWLGIIPFNADSAGARILEGRLYITDDRGLTIYDISEPEEPRILGFTPVPQNAYFVEEDPDTNGEILLISTLSDLTRSVGAISPLNIIDVSDPTRPYVRSSLPGAQQHTWSCVLDCTWGYGSGGVIADLRDPDAPRRSQVSWTARMWEQVEAQGIPVRQRTPHDVTEVAPGFVIASANPVVLVDVRHDPEDPRVVAVGELPDGRFVHGNLWPNGATDSTLLVGGETGGDCAGEQDGAFMTFDASSVSLAEAALAEVAATGVAQRFTFVDEHRVYTGLPTEGDAPYDQYCAHWFTEHPTYADGGLVAMGWYEHGVRFLDVAEDGAIDELGWFLPLGGSTSAAYWVTDEIVYTADYQRGIDILRFTGEPADGTVRVEGTPLPLRAANPARRLAEQRLVGLLGGELVCPLPGR